MSTTEAAVSLSEALENIIRNLPTAKSEPLKNNKLAGYIRKDFKATLRGVVQEKFPSFEVSTSPGQGIWANVVWGAVLDPRVTGNTSNGFFVVYHFHPSEQKVFLSICQGTDRVIKKYGKKEGCRILKERAVLARVILKDEEQPTGAKSIICFDCNSRLPLQYEAGVILGCEYDLGVCLAEGQLRRDFYCICNLYCRLADHNFSCSGSYLI